MLDRIREVQLLAIETGFFQSVIEHAAGRADEGHTAQILLIAWLLADEHRIGWYGTSPEHGLGSVAPEVTVLTARGLTGEFAPFGGDIGHLAFVPAVVGSPNPAPGG
jgi:hypothetical protein